MKTMGTLGMLVGIVAMASPAMGSTHHVNCDEPGQTITKALQIAQPGDTIRVRGTCKETVTITTNRVTLNGGGKAVLQGPGGGQPGEVSHGLLNIVGVQGVEIRGFTVQNSAADGINGRQGAAFTVHDVRVLRNADDGIEATETSTVRFLGTCEVRSSGDDGIAITHGSSALFSAERVTTAENARAGIFVIGTSTAAFDTGTVHTTQNTLGILTLGHSSLTLGRNMPTILAEDNTVDGILVADTSDLRLDGGTITSARNGRTGLWFGGTAGLGNIAGMVLSEHNTEGARAENLSRISQLIAGRMTIRDNTIGIIADSGSDVRIDQGGTITGNGTDIVLIFGSRGTFNGDTIGTITCDKTSLLRIDNVDVTCPSP
jgi:Right handed beta helix region